MLVNDNLFEARKSITKQQCVISAEALVKFWDGCSFIYCLELKLYWEEGALFEDYRNSNSLANTFAVLAFFCKYQDIYFVGGKTVYLFPLLQSATVCKRIRRYKRIVRILFVGIRMLIVQRMATMESAMPVVPPYYRPRTGPPSAEALNVLALNAYFNIIINPVINIQPDAGVIISGSLHNTTFIF